MLLSDAARSRARALSAIAAALSVIVTVLAFFILDDHNWMIFIPAVASIAAAVWPTRVVVAVAMLVVAAIVALGLDGTGVLFGGSVVALMLALNNLQSAATRVRARRAPART